MQLENAELGSWLAGPLPPFFFPWRKKKKKKSQPLLKPKPEALMGVMSVMVGDGRGGRGGGVGAQWPSDGEGGGPFGEYGQKQAPAIH